MLPHCGFQISMESMLPCTSAPLLVQSSGLSCTQTIKSRAILDIVFFIFYIGVLTIMFSLQKNINRWYWCSFSHLGWDISYGSSGSWSLSPSTALSASVAVTMFSVCYGRLDLREASTLCFCICSLPWQQAQLESKHLTVLMAWCDMLTRWITHISS
jgi:hypothetical protein